MCYMEQWNKLRALKAVYPDMRRKNLTRNARLIHRTNQTVYNYGSAAMEKKYTRIGCQWVSGCYILVWLELL
jgi:hypothetical protein